MAVDKVDAKSRPMIRVTEIAFTSYPVTDMPRARRFYEGLLGLKPTANFSFEGQDWVEYDIGASTLAITNMSPEQWKPSSEGPAIALEVADLDLAVGALRQGEVPIVLEPADFPGCRFVVISDPDGNSLALHQRKQPAL